MNSSKLDNNIRSVNLYQQTNEQIKSKMIKKICEHNQVLTEMRRRGNTEIKNDLETLIHYKF